MHIIKEYLEAGAEQDECGHWIPCFAYSYRCIDGQETLLAAACPETPDEVLFVARIVTDEPEWQHHWFGTLPTHDRGLMAAITHLVNQDNVRKVKVLVNAGIVEVDVTPVRAAPVS